MHKAGKVKEMAEGLRRAHSQKIEIRLEEFTDKIKEMTKTDLKSILDENVPHCKRLEGLLYLSKKLDYLKHAEQTEELFSEQLRQEFVECRKEEGKDYEALAGKF